MSSQNVTFPFMVSIGPYCLAMQMCPKSAFTRKNENSETDFNAGMMRFAPHLAGRELTAAFVKRLIGVIHYAHALDDTSVEENFTHSFATGLLEFAQRNPQAWYWLNAMLSKHYSKGQRFDRVCVQAPERPLPAPRRMTVGKGVVQASPLSNQSADRERVWGFYLYADRTLRLAESLRGQHFCVIFWHELTHAFHHAANMENRATRRRFVVAQACAWLDFVEQNPSAWKWFVSLATHGEAGGAQLVSAADTARCAAAV